MALTTAQALIGDSPALREVRARVGRLAAIDDPILITGDRGTGKQTVARALHDASRRCDAAVLTVDCAALADDELHADLFGQSIDRSCRQGRLGTVEGGTLVLREIAAVGPAVRDGLRWLLALGTGGPGDRPVGVRVIATSAHPVDPADELFGPFLANTIDVPPLRERTEDIADLCSHFAAIAARRERRRPLDPEPAVLDLFRNHAWHRNVQELQNFVDRAYLVGGPENPLRATVVEPWLRAATVDPVAATVDALAGKPLADIEKQIILTTLQQFRGHRLKTAGALGIGVRTLGIKLKRWRDEGEPVLPPERAAS